MCTVSPATHRNLPIDTAVPLQVVNETALLRAASLSAIVRHCRIDVYRLLSSADNNIWITTEQPYHLRFSVSSLFKTRALRCSLRLFRILVSATRTIATYKSVECLGDIADYSSTVRGETVVRAKFPVRFDNTMTATWLIFDRPRFLL